MSSDSEKLCCLKILAEVEQYILQDKRDSLAVADVLQGIINVSKPEKPIHPASREVVKLIKEATSQGKLKWHVSRVSGGYNLVSEQSFQYPLRYEVYIYEGFWGSKTTVRYLRICHKYSWAKTDFTKEDEQFFLDVFERSFQENENTLMRAAKEALEDSIR